MPFWKYFFFKDYIWFVENNIFLEEMVGEVRISFSCTVSIFY